MDEHDHAPPTCNASGRGTIPPDVSLAMKKQSMYDVLYAGVPYQKNHQIIPLSCRFLEASQGP